MDRCDRCAATRAYAAVRARQARRAHGRGGYTNPNPNPNPNTNPNPNPNPNPNFSAQALDYLEELGLDFRSDRVGKTWLAVEADAVAEWCAQDSAPEEVRSGSRL